jgi:hypothetical protein
MKRIKEKSYGSPLKWTLLLFRQCSNAKKREREKQILQEVLPIYSGNTPQKWRGNHSREWSRPKRKIYHQSNNKHTWAKQPKYPVKKNQF